MSDHGIAAVGAYAPRLRIDAGEFVDAWGRFEASGIGTKAVPEVDEDAVTIAAEAGRRTLDAAERDPEEIRHLAFASTTPPMAEEDPAARLKLMLGLPERATSTTHYGHTAAGLQALVHTDERPALVVVADCPRGEPDSAFEHAAGAGGVGVVFDADAPATVVDHGEMSVYNPGTRFRESGDRTLDGLEITQYDRDAFVDAVTGAAEAIEFEPDAVDATAVQAPDGRLPYRVAGPVGVGTDTIGTCATVQDLGDTGAASVPLSLATAIADGAERILALGYGSGGLGIAASIECRGAVPTDVSLSAGDSLSYGEYLRRRGDITPDTPDGGGAYVSIPSWKRSIPQRYRLEAGRCPECASLNFLPEGACRHCHEVVEYDPVQLSRTGTVEAVSVISQGGAPPEFATQQAGAGDYATAIVRFDGPDGGGASAPALVVDAEPRAVGVGDRVEATIRRIYEQEGVVRYGFKVRPAA
jgi:hydroxymethylglutaryl-CoA synthase